MNPHGSGVADFAKMHFSFGGADGFAVTSRDVLSEGPRRTLFVLQILRC
jgi:hypothetical protein